MASVALSLSSASGAATWDEDNWRDGFTLEATITGYTYTVAVDSDGWISAFRTQRILSEQYAGPEDPSRTPTKPVVDCPSLFIGDYTGTNLASVGIFGWTLLDADGTSTDPTNAMQRTLDALYTIGFTTGGVLMWLTQPTPSVGNGGRSAARLAVPASGGGTTLFATAPTAVVVDESSGFPRGYLSGPQPMRTDAALGFGGDYYCPPFHDIDCRSPFPASTSAVDNATALPACVHADGIRWTSASFDSTASITVVSGLLGAPYGSVNISFQWPTVINLPTVNYALWGENVVGYPGLTPFPPGASVEERGVLQAIDSAGLVTLKVILPSAIGRGQDSFPTTAPSPSASYWTVSVFQEARYREATDVEGVFTDWSDWILIGPAADITGAVTAVSPAKGSLPLYIPPEPAYGSAFVPAGLGPAVAVSAAP